MNLTPRTSKKSLIEFTSLAKEHFLHTVTQSCALGVKLSLSGGGCAGFSYNWQLIMDPTEIDHRDSVEQFDGWAFWLDHASELYLINSVVDKKFGISGSMIEVKSPLALSNCGCGESVSFTV